MIRRLKKDVLKELPPKRRQVIELPAEGVEDMVRAEVEAYDNRMETLARLRADIALADLSGNDQAYKEAVARLTAQSATFGEMARLRHDVALAKLPVAISHIDEVLEGLDTRKLVVFAHHHDVIEQLQEHFGDKCVVLYGEVKKFEDRQAAVDAFQKDDKIEVFIGGITAAGLGITLTAASTVVFVELDWVPAIVTQAEDRCHRIGQASSVLVQHLVFNNSLDARMIKMIVKKQAVIDAALDTKVQYEPIVAFLPVEGTATSNVDVEETLTVPKKVPAVPEDVRRAAHLAMQMLAGVCDGARLLDGAGFSKVWAHIGHSLSRASSLSDRQATLAVRIAKIFRRQLPENLMEVISR